MKQILSTLIIFAIILFMGLVLFVFEIFPFNPGGPFIPERELDETPMQDSAAEELAALPEFLQEDGVARAKTYTEYMNRGKLLYEQNYHTLAIAEYEAASKLSPSNPSPLIQIGFIHFNDKDYIKAKLNFEAALQIDTDNLNANIYLARSLIAERKMEDAKTILDKIQVHNQTSKYYQALLTAFFEDHGKAKNLLYEVININTDPNLSEYSKSILAAYDEYDSSQGGVLL